LPLARAVVDALAPFRFFFFLGSLMAFSLPLEVSISQAVRVSCGQGPAG
jgi:hypothetical protein